DDQPPKKMSANRPDTDEAIAMFIDDQKALWRMARDAKTMRIEFPTRDVGGKTVEFEIGGLDRAKMPGWDRANPAAIRRRALHAVRCNPISTTAREGERHGRLVRTGQELGWAVPFRSEGWQRRDHPHQRALQIPGLGKERHCLRAVELGRRIPVREAGVEQRKAVFHA